MELDSSFEAGLAKAVLDDAEEVLVTGHDPLVFGAIQESHERLREFADQYPGVDSVIESLVEPEIERTETSLTIRWGWEHEAAPYFEFGTSDHTVDGNPILSFVWDAEDAPAWVAEEFEREGDGYRVFFGSVDVTGIDETRFVRQAINWLRRELAA